MNSFNAIFKMLLGFIFLIFMPYLKAATPVDFSKQNSFFLKSFSDHAINPSMNGLRLKEISRRMDFKKTLHVRVQETYLDYPIWGADAVLHIPFGSSTAHSKTTFNGIIYTNLQADLLNTSKLIFSSAQANKALATVTSEYQHLVGNSFFKNPQKTLMIYIDASHTAHWAFLISFLAPGKNQIPAKPTYIIDAVSFKTYEQWNDLKNIKPNALKFLGGGLGGNMKKGAVFYDGLANHLPALKIFRDKNAICSLINDDVILKKCISYDSSMGLCLSDVVFQYFCKQPDSTHNNVFWNGDMDKVNGGYSPSNDAFFNGLVIKKMYLDWTGEQVLIQKDGSPMPLTMVVHLLGLEAAYWENSTMYFGDGAKQFYPLTSLGIAAHEVSHGFTEQHSHLQYNGQSGGMNESFSDMASMAAEFYLTGKNTWQIGEEVFKVENESLRYMDQPSKDCKGKIPGDECSIDDASQYKTGLDVHFSSGVFNRFFYLLSTSPNWDTKKAFQVMVQANANYWTSTSHFAQAACGIIKAAEDYGYERNAIDKALEKVKVIPQCDT